MKCFYVLFYFFIFLYPSGACQAVEQFALNKDDTVVGFEVGYLLFTRVRGRFEDFHGEMFIDEEYPERSRVAITIKTASVGTGVARRDADIRGPMLFDSERFPTMSFYSTSVEWKAESGGHMKGELTLLGERKPILLDFVRVQGQGLHPGESFKVIGQVKRSDFDMNGYPGVIGNTVSLLICYNMRVCEFDGARDGKNRYNP